MVTRLEPRTQRLRGSCLFLTSAECSLSSSQARARRAPCRRSTYRHFPWLSWKVPMEAATGIAPSIGDAACSTSRGSMASARRTGCPAANRAARPSVSGTSSTAVNGVAAPSVEAATLWPPGPAVMPRATPRPTTPAASRSTNRGNSRGAARLRRGSLSPAALHHEERQETVENRRRQRSPKTANTEIAVLEMVCAQIVRRTSGHRGDVEDS